MAKIILNIIIIIIITSYKKFQVTDKGARDRIEGASRSLISDLTRDGELSPGDSET